MTTTRNFTEREGKALDQEQRIKKLQWEIDTLTSDAFQCFLLDEADRPRIDRLVKAKQAALRKLQSTSNPQTA